MPKWTVLANTHDGLNRKQNVFNTIAVCHVTVLMTRADELLATAQPCEREPDLNGFFIGFNKG